MGVLKIAVGYLEVGNALFTIVLAILKWRTGG